MWDKRRRIGRSRSPSRNTAIAGSLVSCPLGFWSFDKGHELMCYLLEYSDQL